MRKHFLSASALCLTCCTLTFSWRSPAGRLDCSWRSYYRCSDESTSNIVAGGTDLGVALNIDNDTQLGLNVAFFITDNINIELLAATPFKHDVNFSVADPLGTGNQLGEVTHSTYAYRKLLF